MSRTKRSPMIRRPELQPKRSSGWSGLLFVVCFLAIYAGVNVLFYAFDRASSGVQWTINGAITIVIVAALIRWAAREAGLSVGEYLCQTIFNRGRIGWR